MAKDYWLIERKFKDGDKYFISDVNYSEKNNMSKKMAAIQLLAIVARKMSFQCIVQKSRVQ